MPACEDETAVLDDCFPYPLSAFRFEEYITYLDELPELSVYSDGAALHWAGDTRSVPELIAEHLLRYPQHSGRIHPLDPNNIPQAAGYYAIFLGTIARFLPAIEAQRKPFAFTLYPGGGFKVDSAQSDEQLERVCRSPFLHTVIATQPFTRDYLLRKHPHVAAKIAYIWGGVAPRASLQAPESRRFFGVDKERLDIGFVATRYTARGDDKGYDLFVETARALSARGVQATYHVVGPWDSSVVPMDDLSASFVFHGAVSTERLREIGQTLDVILSPNRADVLSKGAFDGFPTGCCVEVGLQEAAIICSDPHHMNPDFREGTELVIIDPALDSILERLVPLLETDGALMKIGQAGRLRLAEWLGRERQLEPRLKILRSMR